MKDGPREEIHGTRHLDHTSLNLCGRQLNLRWH